MVDGLVMHAAVRMCGSHMVSDALTGIIMHGHRLQVWIGDEGSLRLS